MYTSTTDMSLGNALEMSLVHHQQMTRGVIGVNDGQAVHLVAQ